MNEVTRPVEYSDLLTAEEVARRLKVSRHTIYTWLRTGDLRGVHIGRGWRVHVDDLLEFLKR